jgi:gliding motility-associated-like protein
LGDAVVKVDFGAGTGIGPALPPNIISYNYVAQDCPVDGSYTIANRTNGCFSNTWYTYNEDHTEGDINGYMLIVNSSLQPNDFYVDTVRGLCPNTTYEFSAWITNVIRPTACNNAPTPPNVRFTIETVTGLVLGSYNTGDIPAKNGPQWEKYGLFFTTTATDPSVVIRMRNNAPGGCGNDLALDDISFRPCGSLVTSTIIGSANNNLVFCEGTPQNVNLAATVGAGYTNPGYQWQQSIDNGLSFTDIPGANNLNFTTTVNTVGRYLYRLAVGEGINIFNSSCRVLSNNILIEIKANPIATATVTSTLCSGVSVQFTANASTLYLWTGPNGFTSSVQNPSFQTSLNSSGDYFLEITDQFGCKGRDTVSLLINASPTATISSSDDTVCVGTTINLVASGGATYEWSPASFLSTTTGSQVNAVIQNSITYQVIATTADGCKDSAKISIVAKTLPTVSAGDDKIISVGETATLNGMTNDSNNTILWSPPDFLNNVSLLQPNSNPTQDIEYTITATSPFGCGIATDQVTVSVFKGLFIPNSFTPNGDGINDIWRIPALPAFPGAEIFIYNRYGNLVYQLNDNARGWDGRYKGVAASEGAYIYVINLKNGTAPVKGSLLLIR